MKSDAEKKKSNRLARHALMNILVLPGLGTLKAKRWFAGIGQLLIATGGAVMMLIWLYKILDQYYSLMFGDVKPEKIGWIGITGGVLLGISWLWSLVTSLSLFREAARVDSESLARPDVIADATLATIPQWQRHDQVISRTYEFKNFPMAMDFVNAVARIAEQVQHHPDMDIRWNKVTLALTTHDAGGLTEKDFAMARQCDELSLR